MNMNNEHWPNDLQKLRWILGGQGGAAEPLSTFPGGFRAVAVGDAGRPLRCRGHHRHDQAPAGELHQALRPLQYPQTQAQRRSRVPAVLLQAERESETAKWIKEKEPLLRVTDIKNDEDIVQNYLKKVIDLTVEAETCEQKVNKMRINSERMVERCDGRWSVVFSSN